MPSRDRQSSAEITVVIPTRDRSNLLDVAIGSVLESPLIHDPKQIVVVDDDSHDATEAVARERCVTYRRVAFHNISLSRNAGLALARTKYVGFLDHDDAWLPGNMEPQLAALEANPDAAFAYGIARCTTEDFQPMPWTFPKPPLPSGHVPDKLHLGYPNLGVVLFRRDSLEAVGGFDKRIPYYQDGDLMLRIAAHHTIIGVEVVGMLHRLRDPSRKRSDYYWANRSVKNWRPRHMGVGLKAAARLMIKTRGLFYHRFCEDAYACIAVGLRNDALLCITRAFRVSPAHALWHCRQLGSMAATAWLLPH